MEPLTSNAPQKRTLGRAVVAAAAEIAAGQEKCKHQTFISFPHRSTLTASSVLGTRENRTLDMPRAAQPPHGTIHPLSQPRRHQRFVGRQLYERHTHVRQDPLGTPVKEWGGSSEIGCPHNNRGGTQKIPLGGKWQVCFCWPFKLDAQPTTAIINCWGSFWHKNCYSLHHRWPISCLHVVVWGHVRIFFENHHTWHPKPI